MTPYFYILMRTDLASMNAGKAVAQGSHAAHQFQTFMEGLMKQTQDDIIRRAGLTADPTTDGVGEAIREGSFVQKTNMLYEQWLTEGSPDAGFGTAITLEVNGDQLESTIAAAAAAGFAAQVTHDPTYPITDGLVTHLIPLNTCGFIFGDKDELAPILGEFKLMGLCGAAIHGRHR